MRDSRRGGDMGFGRRWRNAGRTVAFLVLAAAVLVGINGVLAVAPMGERNNGHEALASQTTDSDVMAFGSSHCCNQIDTGAIWDETGIASFDDGTPGQTIMDTYYRMREAFSSQVPRVALVDVCYANEAVQYPSTHYFDHMLRNKGELSWADRWESLQGQAGLSTSNRLDYQLLFPVYHSMVDQVTSSSFLHYGRTDSATWKGYQGNYGPSTAYDVPSGLSDVPSSTLDEGTLYYLEQIISLCEEKGVSLVFVNAPLPTTNVARQAKMNAVGTLAETYDIPFLDYGISGWDKIGIDATSDFESTAHLRYGGAAKWSRFLASYLKANYDLPDRRGDAAYSSWQDDADFICQKAADQDLRNGQSLVDMVTASTDTDLTTAYVLRGSFRDTAGWASVHDVLEAAGADVDQYSGDCCFVVSGGKVVFSSGASSFEWHADVGSSTIMARRKSGAAAVLSLPFKDYASVANGVTVLSYDSLADEAVGAYSWTTSYDKKATVTAG
jgi:hypothetical protein